MNEDLILGALIGIVLLGFLYLLVIYPHQKYEIACIEAGYEGQSEAEIYGIVHCYTTEEICTNAYCREIKHHYPMQVE